MALADAPAPTGPVPLTIQQIIDAALYDEFYWVAGQFTFSIPGLAATWAGYAADAVPFVGYAPLTAAQAARFRVAIQTWDAIIAPDFTEVSDSAGPGAVRVGFSSHSSMASIWGFAYGPAYLGQNPPATRAGDIWISAQQLTSDFAYGGYDWSSLLHEVGHALGLTHPFEGASALPTAYQTTRYSILNYDTPRELVITFATTPSGYTNGYASIQEATPMVLDIAALQHRYGAETTTQAGNTTYTFVQGSPLLTTLFDSGGVDTIDLSNFTRTSVVDLRPGSYSSLGFWSVAEQKAFWKATFPGIASFIDDTFANPGGPGSGFVPYTWTDNLGIAFGTIIENAIGGSGEDWLLGNTASNVLWGGAAADRLQGGVGDDQLRGGAGADHLDGGVGADTADFRDKLLPVSLTLALANPSTAYVNGVAEDVLTGVEHVYGGLHSDRLFGDAAGNALFGQNGNDVLRGGGGVDYLYGDTGIDQADYADKTAPVVITLAGAAASIVFVGGVNEDYLRGIEIVYGGSAADTLTGDSFDNLFRGNGGADQIDGGGGLDAADFRDKTSSVYVILNGATWTTVTVGGVAEDRLRNVEQVFTGAGADRLQGDAGANLLHGGAGSDLIRGMGGADVLYGGSGRDVFYFNALGETTVALSGRDTIADFNRAEGDDISLAGIDANVLAPGDQLFTLGALAVGAPGRLSVTADGTGSWLVQGDVNGDAAPDFALLVVSAQALQATDFLL